MHSTGTLFLVPTPIGHMDDITLRALNTLKQTPIIAAEDTRTAKALLQHHGIALLGKKFLRHDMRNERQSAGGLVKLLQSGEDVAYVSDNGTPTISDPGFVLASACRTAEVPVVALPGASALITAVAGSGIGASRFVFLGFLPRKAGDQTKLLKRFAESPEALVLYEAPMRIGKTLELLAETLGDREACVARELSKPHETFHRGTLSELSAQAPLMRGEIVVVVQGA